MTLSPLDRTILRKEKAPGKMIMLVIVAGVLIFDFIQVIAPSMDLQTILIVNIAALALGFGVRYLMNARFERDLRRNEKKSRTETVMEKIASEEFEAGSGTLYIPVLGDLFPKLWKQEMRKHKTKWIRTGSGLYAVSDVLYEQLDVNDEVNVWYASSSATLLDIEKI